MALRVDYIAKETASNLVRNPTLVLATVLTVAVSLALLGVSLLIQEGVDRLNTRFRDDVEFLVWMQADADDEQVQFVADALENSPAIRTADYRDKEETHAEYLAFWADSPELQQVVDPELLPTSFHVTPVSTDLDSVEALGREYQMLPGVREVDYAGEQIRQINALTRQASLVMTASAAVAFLASVLLMFNTIRTALFARRREVEVMKLVGAGNWFIRIPFMLEGLVQGLLGGAFATLAVFGLNRAINNQVANNDLGLFENFALEPSALTPVAFMLLAIGAAIGATGSGIAVTRFLDV